MRSKPILVCKIWKIINMKVGPSHIMFPFGLTNNYTKFHAFYFKAMIFPFSAPFKGYLRYKTILCHKAVLDV